DTYRNVPPFVDGVFDPDSAVGFLGANANKRCVTLDLSSTEGLAVVHDLIRWADVVTESFAPGVIGRMGLDYDTVRAINPNVIMISSCLLGQTGPWSGYSGFGNLAAAVSGFYELVGYEDEPPIGCYGPYTDFIASRYNALAILGALDVRDEAGVGQYIDLSQAEASCHFLAPELLRATTTHEALATRANYDPQMCPHNVYPVAGEDRWIAIAVRDDAMWQRLLAVMQEHKLDARWTFPEREANRTLIDEIIGSWAADRGGEELETALQTQRIAAHRVVDTYDLWEDEQLRYRNHFVPISHPKHGNVTIEGSRILMSNAQAVRPTRSPTFGVDNVEVLSDVLGYSAEQIQALQDAGILH
ncbi:MAG: CoA transferase, partial [Gammaproteobacteria bacterium]|nr:CoA transferase [Gammaproteobacteria bacterium]